MKKVLLIVAITLVYRSASGQNFIGKTAEEIICTIKDDHPDYELNEKRNDCAIITLRFTDNVNHRVLEYSLMNNNCIVYSVRVFDYNELDKYMEYTVKGELVKENSWRKCDNENKCFVTSLIKKEKYFELLTTAKSQ